MSLDVAGLQPLRFPNSVSCYVCQQQRLPRRQAGEDVTWYLRALRAYTYKHIELIRRRTANVDGRTGAKDLTPSTLHKKFADILEPALQAARRLSIGKKRQ